MPQQKKLLLRFKVVKSDTLIIISLRLLNFSLDPRYTLSLTLSTCIAHSLVFSKITIKEFLELLYIRIVKSLSFVKKISPVLR